MESYGECVKPACMENGKTDKDCCAMSGKGHCQDGYEFSKGGNCHRNGAKATCCKKLPEPPKSPGKPPVRPSGPCVKKACKEKGKWDRDCCAKPGEGSCGDGFAFSFGDTCSSLTNAWEICCQELPKVEAEGDCVPQACRENGKYDRDCCAKPDKGSCQDGFQFSFGDKCSFTG